MALFRGLGAFAGTFVVLGGATLGISAVTMCGVRAVVKLRRVRNTQTCSLNDCCNHCVLTTVN